MENHATRGSATGSRGRGRHESENPHHNRNFSQNSDQNRRWAAAHVKKSSRGRSFRDPATPNSAAPGGNGGDGGRGSSGRGRGGKGGAHYVARQRSSEPAGTTAAFATTGASGQASRPPINSFSMSTASTTSVTHFPGAPDRYCWSHQCSVLISWRMGPAVCRLRYVLATFISIIFFLAIVDHFNEVGDSPKVHADLKNRMISS
ncbi:uncharacterized protein LOC131218731 [Magnolia sinica]|uniref:uncharacterized protein LOC131218731 n=1 Tax=Magnolia sinica TaxID=86752 RepID=UPI002659D721|nr:uncharacterized protein LOC131218731 [Magnolia sinica]